MKCSKDAFWKCLKRYISKIVVVSTRGQCNSQVPRLLKDKVKEVLIDSGAEDLVTEDKQ